MEEGLPRDTRGIVDPAAMLQVVDFQRYPAGTPDAPDDTGSSDTSSSVTSVLDGLVEWFWSVAWDLPPGRVHDQQVLNHPAGNISIGTIDDAGIPLIPAQGRVYGVQQGLSDRHLTGRGWTVAARTAVGGLGVLLGRPAREAADRQLPIDGALPDLPADLVSRVTAAPDNRHRVDALRRAIAELVEARDPALVAEARQVVELAGLVEHDRTIRRVEQLARIAGVSVRSLQRLFDLHVGASPSFVVRRWRIIEAAEAARRAVARGDDWEGWAPLAAELGYADQAHLVRDFGRHLGVSPTAYVTRNLDGRPRR